MKSYPLTHSTTSSAWLIGTWRRFGPTGPLYEILDAKTGTDPDQSMRIRVVETGEEVDYPLQQILDDPEG